MNTSNQKRGPSLSAQISRGLYGDKGLKVKTIIDLGFDRRQLRVETSKNGSKGGISTDASCVQVTEDGLGYSHAFGLGGKGDYRVELKVDPKARATEKALTTLHALALQDIEPIIHAAYAYYGKEPRYFAVADESSSSGSVRWYFDLASAKQSFDEAVARANSDINAGPVDEVNLFEFSVPVGATPEEITARADEEMWERVYEPIASHNRGRSIMQAA